MVRRNPRWFYPNQFLNESDKWLRAIDRGDNVAIMFFPKADRSRRLDQFLNDRSIRTFTVRKRTVFLPLNIETAEDREELCDTIERQLNTTSLTGTTMSFGKWVSYFRAHDYRLIILLPEAETMLNPYGIIALGQLSKLTMEFEGLISVLSLYEVNIAHETYAKMLTSLSSLFQSLFSYPLYSRDDSERLLKYLTDRWGGSLSEQLTKRVHEMCGGHPWLLAETVRLNASNDNFSFEDESMMFRMRSIFSMLHADEQNLLIKKLIKKSTVFSPSELICYQYFRQMNMFSETDENLVGYVEYYIRNHMYSNKSFKLVGSTIQLNNVPIDRLFSTNERRVVKLLLEREGEIVSRDEIAQRLWPVKTDEQYSDWAIDQVMARIRKRFSELSLSPTTLRAVRNKGYLLTL